MRTHVTASDIMVPQGSKNESIVSPQHVILNEKKLVSFCFVKHTKFNLGTQFGFIGGILAPSQGHLAATLGPFAAILDRLGAMLWAI